jgi:hypothetical protein
MGNKSSFPPQMRATFFSTFVVHVDGRAENYPAEVPKLSNRKIQKFVCFGVKAMVHVATPKPEIPSNPRRLETCTQRGIPFSTATMAADAFQ